MTISWPVMYSRGGRRRGTGRGLDVVGLTDAVHRDVLRERRLQVRIVGMAAADVRDEEPGRDRVGGDAVGGELERDRVHEVARAGLGRHVRGADRGLDLGRRQRRRHDDPAEPPRAHVTRGGARRGEDAVEIDVDHAVPALVGVELERPLLHARPLPARPRADEPDARIDPGVGEGDVEPAVGLRRLVDDAVESGVIGDVGDRAAHVEPLPGKPRRLRGDRGRRRRRSA